MGEGNTPTVRQVKNRRLAKKRGGTKRSRSPVAGPNRFIPSNLDVADLFKGMVQQPPPPQLTIPPKPLGDLIVDALKAAYNQTWKETDPESYLVYHATWELAPHWPQQWDWLLNLTALAALARGASRIADKGKDQR